MYGFRRGLAYLSVMVLAVLVGCQNAQQVSGTVDRTKVSSVVDKYWAGTEDAAESYANLSIEGMRVFIDLNYERDLQQLERNPATERTVYFDAQGREVKEYNPAGRFETRKVPLAGKALAQRRAEIERDYKWHLEAHRVSVERYGASYNAINGEQLDELLEDVRLEEMDSQGSALSTQQACRYPASAYPRSGTVPYVGVTALPRSIAYVGTIEDGGCDYLYAVTGTSSITALSQNPSASQRCISNVSGMGMVRDYARRRRTDETTSRYIIGPKTRIDFLCGSPDAVNFANSARAR